ncbi:hypothetical protein [Marinimicrobium sp. ARAG 43.8]|uniref:hypothetical protein n=1 Tax=Marinimicrobium sp. ARAG 43.8 TaxID=3418719 RepID=UPI003CED43EA
MRQPRSEKVKDMSRDIIERLRFFAGVNGEGHLELLHRGRFANANVYRYRAEGLDCVIKDYSHCHPLIRQTLGRFFVRREVTALRRLTGVSGVVSNFCRLGNFTLAYPYVEGLSLRELQSRGEVLSEDFFGELEKTIIQMHRRGASGFTKFGQCIA